MKKGKLRITLKSDLCVSDGGVYNSVLDTDICYDDYGFPFIPGKRLRGCLREAAVELKDWGADIDPKKLFGNEGNSASAVRIGNAILEDYARMVGTVQSVDNGVFHAQNILNHYSYVRTQTAIDYDTGVADNTSLRTMRVAKKGLVFEAPIEYEETDKEKIKRCANALRHIGVSRTRGLGDVEVMLVEKPCAMLFSASGEKKHGVLIDGATRLDYTVTLLDPVIFKSLNGGEARTLDYIEGSSILGLTAQYLKDHKEDYSTFINAGNLFVSNAYISRNGLRYTEVPATYYRIKNNDNEFRDKLYDSEEHRECDKEFQLNPMKHGYVEWDKGYLDYINVAVEERYHHRRPDDKGVGRAYKKEDSNSVFYQMSSICANQRFKGFILGHPDQIRKIYESLTEHEVCRLGTGRTSEYGQVLIHVDGTRKEQCGREITVSEFAVKLISSAIVYSDRAFYSVDSEDLIEEILKALDLEEEQILSVQKYIRYVSVGGYNVTWQKRKPTVQAFDKGTVIVFRMKEPVKLHISETLLIGERTLEGHGEIEVIEKGDDQNAYFGKLKKHTGMHSTEEVDVSRSDFSNRIAGDLFVKFLRADAAQQASKYFGQGGDDKKSTVSDLTMMCGDFSKKKSENSASESILTIISEEARNRYHTEDAGKKRKGKIADAIMKTVVERCKELEDEFMEVYKISGFQYDRVSLETEYLLAYLTFGKYLMHRNDIKNKKKGEMPDE